MEKLQNFREKRNEEIAFLKDYYKDASEKKLSLNLQKYLMLKLASINKSEVEALEADMLRHVVAYNTYRNVNIEHNAEEVEYLLKYRELDYRETSLLLYSHLINYNGIYSTSLLLRNNHDVLENLIKAYVHDELLNENAYQLYNDRKISLDTKNMFEQIEFSYSKKIYDIERLKEEETLKNQLQLRLSM